MSIHSPAYVAVVIFLLLVFAAAAPAGAVPADEQPDVTVVTVRGGDVQVLGGWPLNRKWYALAVQNLRRGGAGRIFLDIAFPHADNAHPESDEFFYHTLLEHDEVRLLAEERVLDNDSVSVLGGYRLPSNRFFAPFSSTFSVRGDRLIVEARSPYAFARWLLPEERPSRPLLVELPDEPPEGDLSFLDVVRGSAGSVAGDVVIALDYPGVTSYVAHGERALPVATAALQVHAARQVQRGNYATEWPLGWLALLFGGALSPLLGTGGRRERRWWIGLSLALCLVLPMLLAGAGIYISTGWFAMAIMPAVLLGYLVARERRASATETLPQVLDHEPADQDELDALRYRLQFYEHLEQQEAPVSSERTNGGLHYAEDSPLVPVLRKARKVAQTELSVLIQGESGVGKELLARYVHDHSPRAEAPFLAINCAAVPAELIESELFGHEKGAFTGAQQRKTGLFERADDGTLFLDEVSETSVAFQAKLLRVLQEGSFVRVGGTRPIDVSVRVLAATHRHLPDAIEEGRFREDLYYRLHGITLDVPPLRERPADVVHLFHTFLNEAEGSFKTSDALVEWLRVQPWPGNVRELKAATQRAVVNAELKGRTFLLPKDFELPGSVSRPTNESLSDQVLDELRRQGFHYRSISATAEALGVHRATVTEHLRGWVTHYLARYGPAPERVETALRGTADVDEEQLRKRVRGYADSIRERITDGLRENETPEEICLGRFRNMPQDFYPDIETLIDRHREKVA